MSYWAGYRGLLESETSLSEQAPSIARAKEFLTKAQRNVRGQVRAHRLRTNPDVAKRRAAAEIAKNAAEQRLHQDNLSTLNIPGVGQRIGGGRNWAQERGAVKREIAAHNNTINTIDSARSRWRGNEKMFGKKNALLIGGGILATGIGLKGIQTYRKWRKKAKAKTRYRGYDVYPEHNYAAVGQQTYNRPYYNEDIIEHVREFKKQTRYLF